MAKKPPATPEEIERLKTAMDRAELDFANAKIAFYHQTEYKDQPVDYERLATFAETFIAANYAFQKAHYGRVRVKLSVARLMRE
jgi:hypothetical protein